MTLTGTVVNGLVVFHGPQKFPEGSEVTVRLSSDDELDDDLAGMPVPEPTETYEEHLAILRQSIADAQAGIGLMTVAEAMAFVDAEVRGHADRVRT